MRSILVKDTTKEEREKIVLDALRCGDGVSCENCSGCGVFGAGDPLELYKPYIEGRKELREVTQVLRVSYIHG